MEQIDFKLLIKYFFNKLVIIIAVSLLFAFVGLVYLNHTKKNQQNILYQSCITMIIERESSEFILDNNKIDFSQKNLNEVYIEIIKSDEIINKILDNLELNYQAQHLINNMTFKFLDNNQAIRIIYTSPVKGEPELIIKELSSLFQEKLEKTLDIKSIKTFIRTGMESQQEISNDLKIIIKFMLIGFILIVLFFFVIYYFSFSIKSVSDVEEIGFEIIGTIPKARGIKRE